MSASVRSLKGLAKVSFVADSRTCDGLLLGLPSDSFTPSSFQLFALIFPTSRVAKSIAFAMLRNKQDKIKKYLLIPK